MKIFSKVRVYHNSPLLSQENQSNVPPHLVIQQQIGLPPQTQRPRIQRDEQTADFRKFKQNFILAAPKVQRGNVSIILILEDSKNIVQNSIIFEVF